MKWIQQHSVFLTSAGIVMLLIAGVAYQSGIFERGAKAANAAKKPAAVVKSSKNKVAQSSKEATVAVFLSGAVKKPGVYTLPASARVVDALVMAGGLTKKAAEGVVNLAEHLTDEQQIYFPSKSEITASSTGGSGSRNATNPVASVSSGGGAKAPAQEKNASGSSPSGKVNVNTADQATLETLTGIGPATAQKIIAYRSENGRFNSISDLKLVNGIGDKKVEQLRSEACTE